VILIGGTNGKGTTAHALAQLLTASGRKTLLFTSPHLLELKERIQIDGKTIEAERLERLAEKLNAAIEERGLSFLRPCS
jgi:dihydrofolate synthase/folylpolyglutamate synthase